MTAVKICGVKTLEDALLAAEAGADMLGLNFYRRSPRYIEPAQAKILCAALREQLKAQCPLMIGVFVNVTDHEILSIKSQVRLDFVQLSGHESDYMLRELHGKAYKAIRPLDKVIALEDIFYFRPHFPQDDRIPSLLLDAYHPELYGGTGEQASTDVALAVKAEVPRLMLAGGLKPENVAERIKAVQPWGVDVASGVEGDEPGVKSAARLKAFIAAVQSAS